MHRISYQFSYQFPSGPEGIFLPVSLQFGQETIVIEAAVDTGASYCLFARSVGESLGINVESGFPQIFASAGGRVEAFGHSIQLTVLGIELDAMVFFFANGNIQKNLLGRRGWLDRVKFGLDEYQQFVYLSGPESIES